MPALLIFIDLTSLQMLGSEIHANSAYGDDTAPKQYMDCRAASGGVIMARVCSCSLAKRQNGNKSAGFGEGFQHNEHPV